MRADRRAVQLPRGAISCPRRSAFCARRVIGGVQPTGGSSKRHVQPRCAECVPRQPAANAPPVRPARSAAQRVREAWSFTRRLLCQLSYTGGWSSLTCRFSVTGAAAASCISPQLVFVRRQSQVRHAEHGCFLGPEPAVVHDAEECHQPGPRRLLCFHSGQEGAGLIGIGDTAPLDCLGAAERSTADP